MKYSKIPGNYALVGFMCHSCKTVIGYTVDDLCEKGLPVCDECETEFSSNGYVYFHETDVQNTSDSDENVTK